MFMKIITSSASLVNLAVTKLQMSATSWEVLDRTGFEFTANASGVSDYAQCLSVTMGCPGGIK